MVVEIDVSLHGTTIMCLSRNGIERTHAGRVGSVEMRKRVLRYIKSIRDMVKRDSDEEPAPQVKTAEEVMDLAAGISSEILIPVADIVRSRKTVIFVPSSYLQLIPLSTLVLDGKPLVLQKAVYQVPSLSTLFQLAKGARTYEDLSISVLAEPADQGKVEIPLVGAEAVAICKTFGTTPEDHKNISPEQVTSIFENSDIIHIATHGEAILSSPWQSYLDLSKKFRVLDLAKLHSLAALVVFGACWSGAGQVGGGNELLGFSHAVLQSGALSSIGGLWAVDDRASMLLMYLFYKNIGRGAVGASLVDCWQAVHATFYELDVPKAQLLLTELLDMWVATRGQCARPKGFKTTGAALFELRETLADSGLDFKHPYYWAPFTLVGYGSLVLSPGEVMGIDLSDNNPAVDRSRASV
ncbi:MAG: hypothetical protein M1839_003199 [Geoglossum umbratile]|nr:MAG: hypothetical protein M1839_003199 [Geoglossum umbratile]